MVGKIEETLLKFGSSIILLSLITPFVILDSYRLDNEENISDDSSKSRLKLGSNITLSCRKQSWYKHCDWYHESETCKFEWNFSSKNVEGRFCSPSLVSRVEFVENSDNYRCSIKLYNIRKSDEGKWKCKLYEYVSGKFYGETDTTTFILGVDQKKEGINGGITIFS